MNETATPRLDGGTDSLATNMANEINTPVTTAVIMRKTSNISYTGAKLLNKFRIVKIRVKPSINFRLGKWLVNDIVIGVPMANVIAKAETSVPAVAIEIVKPSAMSGKIPTMTNSLVPSTNVNKAKDNMSVQSWRLSFVAFVKSSHFFQYLVVRHQSFITLQDFTQKKNLFLST